MNVTVPHQNEQRPPVPRLVFAEEVERVIQKKSGQDSAQKSVRDSGRINDASSDRGSDPRTSGSRKAQRDMIEEALRNGQWSMDPFVMQAVNSGDKQTSSRSDPSKRLPSISLQPTNPTLISTPPTPTKMATSLFVKNNDIHKDIAALPSSNGETPKKSARVDNSLLTPTLEPIPQVLPRIVHEPERREESGGLPDLVSVDIPMPFDKRDIVKSGSLIIALFVIPIAVVICIVNIPLAQTSVGLSGNLVYLLAYFPLWGVPTCLGMFLFLEHQLRAQHPDLGHPSFKLSLLAIASHTILMPATYYVISVSTRRFPIPFGTFVAIPVALCIFFAIAFFTIADSEQRHVPGYLRNFMVNVLVLVVLELHRLLTVAFVFFFPQIDLYLQMLIAFSFHTLIFTLRWVMDLIVTKWLFKGRSINRYKHNRSFKEPATRETSLVKLGSPKGSAASLDDARRDSAIVNPSVFSSPVSFTFIPFLVDMRGLSFWPVCFLSFTIDWNSFVFQLVCVIVIYLLHPLRFSAFWFHFSGKNHNTLGSHRKEWMLAELTSKISILEYRKQICAEFSFHSIAELISLVSFPAITSPLCNGPNKTFYAMCNGELDQPFIYVAITTTILLLISISFVLYIIKGWSYCVFVTLFSHWLTFSSKHFVLLLFTIISALIYPYQLLLLHNQIN